MYLARVCIDSRNFKAKVSIYDASGKALDEVEYKDVELIEIEGVARISLNSIHSNRLCIQVEILNRIINQKGKILRLGRE